MDEGNLISKISLKVQHSPAQKYDEEDCPEFESAFAKTTIALANILKSLRKSFSDKFT